MICPNCKSNNIAVSNIQTSYTTYQTVAVCQNCGTSGVIGQGVINQSTQSQSVQNYQTPYQVDYSKNTNTNILKRNVSNWIAVIIVLILVMFFIVLILIGIKYDDGTVAKQEVTTPKVTTQQVKGIDFNGQTITVPYGELLSVIQTEDIVVVKVKIKSSYSNETTISQNYHNIEALVDRYNFDEYSQIQYWAVADMQGGDVSKVVSFDVPQWVSEAIKEDSLVAIQLGDYVENFWVLPSLRE